MADQKCGALLAEAVEEIRRRLIVLFAGNETNADLWLRTPNQHLDDRVPMDMIISGGTDRRALELLVGAMEDRTPN